MNKLTPLLILILIVPWSGFSQLPVPAGLANSCTLDEKQGYDGFNYATIFHAPSGKVYTRTYDGLIAIHGNNYTNTLPAISGQAATGGNFIEISENEAWFYDSKKIVVIKQDTIFKSVPYPEESLLTTDFKGGILCIFKNRSATDLYFFNGETLRLLKSEMNVEVTHQSALFKAASGKIYFITTRAGELHIYEIMQGQVSLRFLKSYTLGNAKTYSLQDENNLVIQGTGSNTDVYSIRNGLPERIRPDNNTVTDLSLIQELSYPFGLKRADDRTSFLFDITKQETDLPNILTLENMNLCNFEKYYGSFYTSTLNKPQRIFTTLKKYPFIFTNNTASSIFSVQEDVTGNIWAGSYRGGVSVLRDNRSVQLPGFSHRITNGGCTTPEHVYLLCEGVENGILQIDRNRKVRLLTKGINGFYTFISNDKKSFYYGTAEYNGLWETSLEGIERGLPVWNKIDSSKGISLRNVLTITEDKAGNIWCGHPKRGIAVYNPKTGKARTWLTDKKETTFGAYSSLTDNQGTVWLGSGDKGLWYYNDYTREPSPENCKRIDHPLLNSGKSLMALSVYNNWLLISGYDKMMLLNLDSFYVRNKIILRYLNPQEASFTSVTEQNTLLTSRKDSSVWFSTSDMLYQWDVKKWLSLPVYPVKTSVFITSNGVNTELSDSKDNSFSPGFGSFDIHIRYLSPDNMPRYTRFTMVKDGDSILFPEPDLQNIYPVKNISSGDYRFILEVFEMDGRITRYTYQIHIQKFLWQQWWFWISLSILLISLAAYFLNQKRKRQLAEQKVKTKEAELLTLKSEQERKIATLKLASLSSQFRPHFILNALNTIGAQMDDNPEAETVLSRLGESVNIIFNHAKQQYILHSFTNEWKLVKNVIDIHRLMYLKALNFTLPDEEMIWLFQDFRVPMGILQIPVENALLHGLSNKETGPWNLSIHLLKTDHYAIVNINDNGVGRKKSASLSNFTKHGTGTKNLTEIISIINDANADKITITYKDEQNATGEEASGTTVIIEIPINLNYEPE